MAEKANDLSNLVHRRSMEARRMDDILADSFDKAGIFQYAVDPHEPDISGGRHLGARFRLTLANRHHLKNQIWDGSVKKLRHN